MTTTALSADIEILATFKDIVESTPVKAVFGSVIGILTLLGDEIKEGQFAELAKDCVEVCHVLKSVTEGKDADDVGGPRREQIEDLEVIVRHIESVVSEWVNYPGDLWEHHTGPTDEYLIAWRTEMLRVLNGGHERGGALNSEIGQHVRGSVPAILTAPASALSHFMLTVRLM